LDGDAPIGFDLLHLSAVTLYAGDREPPDLGAEECLQHVAQLLRANDSYDQLHTASFTVEARATGMVAGRVVLRPGRSGRTRTAPSPRAYPSSPWSTTSSPIPSSRSGRRSGVTSEMSLSRAKVPTAL